MPRVAGRVRCLSAPSPQLAEVGHERSLAPIALEQLNVGSVPGNGQPSSASCRAVSLSLHAHSRVATAQDFLPLRGYHDETSGQHLVERDAEA